MKSLLLAALGPLLVVVGCAETTSLTVADGATCAAPVTPALAAACDQLAELASPANLVAGVAPGVTTYALASLPARANQEHPMCAVEPWQDGNEAVVRFTAPVGGRWRLTANGLHLGVLRASRDWSLRLRIGGLSLGETVTQATVELLDPAGMVLTSAPAQSVFSSQRTTSMVPFTSELALNGDTYLAALPRTARVRVRVTDTMSRQSAPFEAALEMTAAVGIGAACGDASVSCGDGLRCSEFSSTGEQRCEPALAPRSCDLSARPGTWAPPTSGTWTIEGTSRSGGGFTSCLASRTSGVATAEFVAPTTGRYVFETMGLWVMDLRSACDAPEPTTQRLREPASPRLEADLRAGERVALAVMSMSSEAPFAVTVRVP